jgi:hypothetical protein
MNRKFAVCLAAASVVTLLVGTAPGASAAVTLIVDKADVGCSAVASPFCTIQQAVDAAGPGTIVLVEPGIYIEQVSVGPGKDGLKLKSDPFGAVTIKAPNPTTAPGVIVRVTGARNVLVAGFTITGPGGPNCDSLTTGIRVEGNGKAFIRHDHITAIRFDPLSGCQFGTGIRVGITGSTSGEAVITDTVIDDYQKGGVVVTNSGSFAQFRRVTITGAGPTDVNGQNGLQLSFGASADVRNVQISGNVYTPQTVSATGVLLFNPGGVYLRDVTSSDNDVNFFISGAQDRPKVFNSTATDATFVGFFVDNTSFGGVYKYLTATGSGDTDIEDDSTGGFPSGTANHWRYNSCGSSIPAGLLCPGDRG